MRFFNMAILITSSAILLQSNPAISQQEPNEAHLDEAFLEFLAELSIEDGEITDPLDMLDIADESMPDTAQHPNKTQPNPETDPSKAAEETK